MGKENSSEETVLKLKDQLNVSLLKSSEGRLLLAGVSTAVLFTIWLGVKLFLSPQDSQVYIGMTATHVLFGRAAGIAFGYSLGMEDRIVIPFCMIIETIMVLIFYPLFVFSCRHLLVINWLKKIFERTEKAAEARKNKVRKYGIVGLFVFVWFPFWMTGPVVGCVIGFLLRLRTWVNMTVVLAGTYMATIGWAVFLSHFHDRVSFYSPYATIALIVILVIIIILGHLLHKGLHNNRNKH